MTLSNEQVSFDRLTVIIDGVEYSGNIYIKGVSSTSGLPALISNFISRKSMQNNEFIIYTYPTEAVRQYPLDDDESSITHYATTQGENIIIFGQFDDETNKFNANKIYTATDNSPYNEELSSHNVNIVYTTQNIALLDDIFLPGKLIKSNNSTGDALNYLPLKKLNVNTASGKYSHAEGYFTTVSGNYSHAEGSNNIVSGSSSHVEGTQNRNNGTLNHVEGQINIVGNRAANTHVEGYFNLIKGTTSVSRSEYNHIEGYNNIIDGTSKVYLTHIEGLKNIISGGPNTTNSSLHIEGTNNIITSAAGGSHIEGSTNTVTYAIDGSHIEGYNNTITRSTYGAHIEGYNNTYSSGQGSHIEGYNNTNTGDYNHVEGSRNETEETIDGTLKVAKETHIEGSGNIASSRYAHIEGFQNSVRGDYAHAEGRWTYAYGEASHAEGYWNFAVGAYSHAEGELSNSHSITSHTEGYQTYANIIPNRRPVIAYGTTNTSNTSDNDKTGYAAHAEGFETVAFGTASHTEGYQTKTYILTTTQATTIDDVIFGDYAHAEGSNTSAYGQSSHAEGEYSTASGRYSHAEGYYTTASGEASHASGYYTIARGETQTVIGKYNIADTTSAVIIGNGISTKRSNLLTLEWNGIVNLYNNARIADPINIVPTNDGDLITKKYLEDNYSSSGEANQNAFSHITIGSNTIDADTPTDTVELIPGANMTISPTVANDLITFNATDTRYTFVQDGSDGHKIKITPVTIDANGSTNGTTQTITIPDNNTTYTLTQDSTDGHKLTFTPSSGTATTITIPDDDTTYDNVTTTTHGLMTAEDKVKLNSIEANANNYVLPQATSSILGGVTIGNNITVNSGKISITDTNIMNAISTKLGTNNGIATLDNNGKIPTSQLPAFVDDIIEGYYYNNKFYKDAAHTQQITPDTGSTYIYIDLDTNKTYRYSGTQFVEISESLAIGETSSTAFAGDRGVALENSLNDHLLDYNNPHNVDKADVGLGNVDNTSDLNKPISTATQAALDDKADNVDVTTTTHGLMTAADKVKLNGIEAGATKLVPATDSILGGIKIGDNVTMDSSTNKLSVTKSNVISALGYEPPSEDNNTTYKAIVGAANTATANAAATNGKVWVNLINTTGTAVAQDKINFKGSGLTVTNAKTENNTSVITWTWTHPTITVSDTTSTASPAHGGTFTVVDGVTRDATGHVTGINVKTVTLPAQYVHPNITRSDPTTANVTLDHGDNFTVVNTVTSNNGHVTAVGTTKYTLPAQYVHPTFTNTQTTNTSTLAYSGEFIADTLTYDTNGHITGSVRTTYTLPPTDNTDTKVRQTLRSAVSESKPILLSYAATSTTTGNIDNISYRNNNVYVTLTSTAGLESFNAPIGRFYSNNETSGTGATSCALSIGPDDNKHITMDGDTIQAKNTTSAISGLSINPFGGEVNIGNNSSLVISGDGSTTSISNGQITTTPETTVEGVTTPANTTVTGNLTVTGNINGDIKFKTARKIDGVDFDGSSDIIHYGTCSTAADTAAKVVACTGYKLVTGSRIMVKFTVTNTNASPTLNVNSTGAKAIKWNNLAYKNLVANRVYEFVYDGSSYILTDVDYVAGTGLSLSGTTINHSNSITAGSISGGIGNDYPGASMASFGSTIEIPSISYDAQGHITSTDKNRFKIPNTVVTPSSSGTGGTNGLMSATDKEKLDSIEAGLTNDNKAFVIEKVLTGNSTITLNTLNTNDTIYEISVYVMSVFSGTPALNITYGSGSSAVYLIRDSYSDLTNIGLYETKCYYKYNSSKPINISITGATGTTGVVSIMLHGFKSTADVSSITNFNFDGING